MLDERGLNEKVLGNIKYITTILKAAVRKGLPFIKFLMEERHLLLSNEQLKKIIREEAEFSGIEMNSYLQSYLCDSDQEKNTLLTIANKGLIAFGLDELFKLYNSKIVKKGKCSDFSYEIHLHIKGLNITLEQLRNLFCQDTSILSEALFYYSEYYFKHDLSQLKLLLELGVDLNSENSKGIAAIHLALYSGGYNKIVKFFVENGADLSKKNRQGKTAAELIESAIEYNKKYY